MGKRFLYLNGSSSRDEGKDGFLRKKDGGRRVNLKWDLSAPATMPTSLELAIGRATGSLILMLEGISLELSGKEGRESYKAFSQEEKRSSLDIFGLEGSIR